MKNITLKDVIYFSLLIGSILLSIGAYLYKVEDLSKRINKIEADVNIPLIQEQMKTMREDISEIKTDIKILIKK